MKNKFILILLISASTLVSTTYPMPTYPMLKHRSAHEMIVLSGIFQERINAQNNLNKLIVETENMIKENKSDLSEESINLIEKVVEKAKKILEVNKCAPQSLYSTTIEGNEKARDALRHAIHDLKQATANLYQR